MKLHLILFLCVLGVTAQSAWAEEPVRPSGQTLGMIEAIFSKCAQVDPKAAARYEQQRIQWMTKGISEEVLAEIRSSDEYRQSYDSTTESLRAVSEHDALVACTRPLTVR